MSKKKDAEEKKKTAEEKKAAAQAAKEEKAKLAQIAKEEKKAKKMEQAKLILEEMKDFLKEIVKDSHILLIQTVSKPRIRRKRICIFLFLQFRATLPWKILQ